MSGSSPAKAGKKEDGMDDSARDLASILFCVALAFAVAYPLGVESSAGLAMGIQLLVWVPSALAQKETFYDFTGMVTFIAMTTLSQLKWKRRFFEDEVKWSALMVDNPRHLIASCLVLVWTARLGMLMFVTVLREGHDSRFNGVRSRPLKFLLFFSVQGIWVFLTPLPMLALHTLGPAGDLGALQGLEAIGLAVWIAGFGLEVVADNQKTAFKRDRANKGKFIDVGLWSRCRHPNYVGEMVLWIGFFIFCSRGVVEGAGWIVLAGPIFVVLLLVCLSTPMAEAGSNKKYGGLAGFQEYKRRVPCLYFRF